MPATNYIPPKDQDFKAWALNFSTLITATPTAFGLVAGQATAYAALYAAFNTALTAATDPSTRTKVTVAAKNVARANLETSTRMLAGVVQGFPTITPSQLESLGLTVRSTARPPIPDPVTVPVLSFVGNGPLSAVLRYADELTPASRKKPFGAVQIQVFVSYGTTAPTGLAQMQMLGVFTKNPVNVTWPGTAAGDTAWVAARWVTRTGKTGPLSAIISTSVIGL